MSSWKEQNEGFLIYSMDKKGTFFAENKEERKTLLKQMHAIIANLNDEKAYLWWILVVPDGATDDDFDYMAEDAKLCTDVCELFGKIINKYVFKEYAKEKEESRETKTSRLTFLLAKTTCYLYELWRKTESSPKQHAQELFGFTKEEADEFFPEENEEKKEDY